MGIRASGAGGRRRQVSGRVERALTLALLALGMTGCFQWQTVGALPRSTNLPADTRVTKFDGTVILFATSRLESDTIRGFAPGSATKLVIPLAHVDLIETKKFQPRESLIAGTGAAALFYLILKMVSGARPLGRVPTIP